ncbi:MAG: M18 family aminopeptidase [Oscillospiraceae bacterium]|nr:M18 family aminopeptidase [Oscillospiraceae bacterium]
MNELNARLLDFIRRSPTALHVSANAAAELAAAGYTELDECADWQLCPGGRYFVRRNSSALIAFALPADCTRTHFQIFAAHTDSPALRVKTAWKLEDKLYLRLNAETYGGGLWGTWSDRPLSVAGRVGVRTENGVRMQLVNIDRDLLMLPSVPIHFNREANNGVKIDPQADLCPVLTMDTSLTLEQLLAEEIGCAAEDILSHELMVYCRSQGFCWGAREEFLSCPRLDDAACCFAGLAALLESGDKGRSIRMLACMDNEECGSTTRQGAVGTFLIDTLERIGEALGWSRSRLLAAQAGSYMLSADNAHAVHPAHGELYDAANRTAMNGGVVLKHAVAYSTSGESDGILRALCKKHGLPLQDFANRSNIRGGSTLANIATTHLNIRMADIGLPQLAMHASFETMGAKDLSDMVELARHYFGETLTVAAEGDYRWEA